jgi:hypothetical protein
MEKSESPFGANDIMVIIAFDETSHADIVFGGKRFGGSGSRKGEFVDEFGLDVDKMESIILWPIKWTLCEDTAQSQEGLRDRELLDVRVLCHGCEWKTDVVRGDRLEIWAMLVVGESFALHGL